MTSKMSKHPVLLQGVPASVLRNVFGNAHYSESSRTYTVEGYIRFNIGDTYEFSYRTIRDKFPMMVDGDIVMMPSITSTWTTLPYVTNDSPLDVYLMENDIYLEMPESLKV
jgi:hypothetical protein